MKKLKSLESVKSSRSRKLYAQKKRLSASHFLAHERNLKGQKIEPEFVWPKECWSVAQKWQGAACDFGLISQAANDIVFAADRS